MNQRVTLAVLLSFCTLLPALGQTGPTADKDDVVRITTNLVQIDAVVTKDGKPVTNLTADDFEIYEDGRKQAITNFVYISNVAGSAVATPNPVKPEKATADVPPPTPIVRDAPRRTMAIVVDDLGLSAESINQVRKRLAKFVTEELQPNDLVAIIRTGGEVGALQQFTNDKRVLSRAVSQLRWNVCSRLGQTVLTPLEGLGGNSCFMEQTNLGKTVRSLRFILESMGRLPGRKSMILMSDSIPIRKEEQNGTGIAPIDDTAKIGMKSESFDPKAVGGNILNYGGWLQRLAETAIRSSVVIYSVDTQGLQYTGLTAADSVSGKLPEKIPAFTGVVVDRSRQLQENREGSERLAKQTGGFQIHNSNNFELDRIVDDQSGYYLIGYRPGDETFNRQFHQIKAKVKRSGMTLRTRYGFFGVTEDDENRARPSVQDQTNLALLSPFAAQDLEVDLNSFFTNGKAEGSIIRSFVYLNPANLSFVAANGRHETALEMHGVIFGDNGAVIDKVKHDIVLSLSEAEYAQAMRDGLPDAVRLRFDMPVKGPGSYQVRIAVRDRTSAKIGSAGQFVDVPDLNKTRVALSGIVLRSSGEGITAATVMATPPGRRFALNSNLHFAFLVYNALPTLVMQTKVFRDGKVVKFIPATPIGAPDKASAGPVLATAMMPLTADLEPGNYYLQVFVFDKAKDKQVPAIQWATFEIVK
jgi:VWFA-related protein